MLPTTFFISHRLNGRNRVLKLRNPWPAPRKWLFARFDGSGCKEEPSSEEVEVGAAVLMRTPDTLTGERDRALLALGFAGAFRRSELVALDGADLREDAEGLRVMVRRAKVDQEG